MENADGKQGRKSLEDAEQKPRGETAKTQSKNKKHNGKKAAGVPEPAKGDGLKIH